MAVLEELGTYLAAQGVGTVGTDIFYGLLPDSPTPATAVLEYPGREGDYIQERAKVAIEYPRIQVRARAATYAAGRALIELSYQALDAIINATLSGTRYLAVRPIQAPFLLERDANLALVFAFNVEAHRCAL